MGIDGDDSQGNAPAFKVVVRPSRGRGGTKRYKRYHPVASAARGVGAEHGPDAGGPWGNGSVAHICLWAG
jgi:hypothetical protein